MTVSSANQPKPFFRGAQVPPQANTCAVAVMAKASIPGRAKTRLAPPLTAEQAAELNTAFLLDIAENLDAAGRRAKIAPFMAFGPPGSAPFFEERLPSSVGLMEIWYPDFGQCLFETIEELLRLGYGSACVLNSDSPTLQTDRLVEMAEALAAPGDRAVLGPSTDGGYYLLGLKASHHRLFEDITWSTDLVSRQTIERAREIDLDMTMLSSWYDVDDAESLGQLGREIEAGPSTGTGAHWPRYSAETLHRLADAHPDFPFRPKTRRDTSGAV